MWCLIQCAVLYKMWCVIQLTCVIQYVLCNLVLLYNICGVVNVVSYTIWVVLYKMWCVIQLGCVIQLCCVVHYVLCCTLCVVLYNCVV